MGLRNTLTQVYFVFQNSSMRLASRLLPAGFLSTRDLLFNHTCMVWVFWPRHLYKVHQRFKV